MDSSDSDTDPSEDMDRALLNDAILQALVQMHQTDSRKRKRNADVPISNLLLSAPPCYPHDLTSLITLAQQCSTNQMFRDCQHLGALTPLLLELQQLVGLSEIKQSIAELVLLRLQKGQVPLPILGHICIVGAPGTGKTTVVNLLAKLLAKLDGSNGQVVPFRPETAIAGFLGQTAPKTAALITSAFGGVLLIDEVTSLTAGRTATSGDSFSKAAIDVLNRMLTEDGSKFTCIVAGYETEIERDFFSVNPGLRRRFTACWKIPGYTPLEMLEVTRRLLATKQMRVSPDCVLDTRFFLERLANTDKPVLVQGKVSSGSLFGDNVGSVEVFVDCLIRSHATRVFGQLEKGLLLPLDVEHGFSAFRTLRNTNVFQAVSERPNTSLYN